MTKVGTEVQYFFHGKGGLRRIIHFKGGLEVFFKAKVDFKVFYISRVGFRVHIFFIYRRPTLYPLEIAVDFLKSL
jgi:hypothetical protein